MSTDQNYIILSKSHLYAIENHQFFLETAIIEPGQQMVTYIIQSE